MHNVQLYDLLTIAAQRIAMCVTLRKDVDMESTIIPTFTLGDRLAKSRRTAGIASADMAKRLGVSRTTISNYESGRTEPTARVLRTWSEVTGVGVDWMLAGQADDELRSRCFLDDLDDLQMMFDLVAA